MNQKAEEAPIYTIPLKRVILAPRYKRAAKAVRIVREFAARHTRTEVNKVKLDPRLNEIIWENGVNVKLRRVRVSIEKDDEGNVIVKPA